MMQVFEAALDDLEATAAQIASVLPDDGVIFLRGDLAAGKTTLVQALAKVRGCDDGTVTSPTFSIQHIYGCGMVHYDLYQCPNEKFLEMGLLESLEMPGWHLIEWGDAALERLLQAHGFETAVVRIEPAETGRRYEVSVHA